MNFLNNFKNLKNDFWKCGCALRLSEFQLFKNSLKVKEISRGTSFKSWNSGLFAHIHTCMSIHPWPGNTHAYSMPGTSVHKQEDGTGEKCDQNLQYWEWIHVYVRLSPVAVHLKLTTLLSVILQHKVKSFKTEINTFLLKLFLNVEWMISQ